MSILEDDVTAPGSEPTQPETTGIREEIRILIDLIPDSDLASVKKMLLALEGRWNRLF